MYTTSWRKTIGVYSKDMKITSECLKTVIKVFQSEELRILQYIHTGL